MIYWHLYLSIHIQTCFITCTLSHLYCQQAEYTVNTIFVWVLLVNSHTKFVWCVCVCVHVHVCVCVCVYVYVRVHVYVADEFIHCTVYRL